MAEQDRKRTKNKMNREAKISKMEMEDVDDKIVIKPELVSPTKAEVDKFEDYFLDKFEDDFQDASFDIKTEIKMGPRDVSNFQIMEETNTEVRTEKPEAEPMEVFVKGVYLTKEKTKWMEVHHDVKNPRTVKSIKIAGYTSYREKYQEVHFDLKRWNELYGQKDIIQDYLNQDESVFEVPKVKLSGNIKMVFKDESFGKFVTFSQNRNSVSMKGPTLSYMLKYNDWVQDCLGVQKFDFHN